MFNGPPKGRKWRIKVTKKDVIECFNTASKEVLEVVKDLKAIESDLENPDGLIMTLTDRLLQAGEMEKQDRQIIPANAAVSPFRGAN